MHIVIIICNDHALEEFVFTASPAVSQEVNRDIRLPSKRFHLQSDPVIALSISSKGLSLVEKNSNVYQHISDKSKSNESTISKDTVLSLITQCGEELKMHVFFETETGMCFYKTERSRVISLGRGLNQSICCIDSPELSDAHLILKCSDEGGTACIKGSSGCYIGGRHIGCMMSVALSYGDLIMAGSVKILWLNDFVGIECLDRNRPCLVRLMKAEHTDMYADSVKEGIMEHIAPPRNLIKLDEAAVELSPPPPRREIKRQKPVTVVGPALTMAVPMSLGCGLYIYFSARSGMTGASMYMYTGLVTAFSSALLGAMWAIINIRTAAKQERIDEEVRISSYTDYIRNCDKQIRDKYRYNRSAMLRNNPAVREIFSFSNDSHLLNRRASDEDLFIYRIGTGSCPFNVRIEVPKTRFLPVPDELESLPQMLKSRYEKIYDVPACIDLSANRLTGFVSSDEQGLLDTFLNISLQIISTTGPDILRTVFMFYSGLLPDTIINCYCMQPQAQNDEGHYVAVDPERIRELGCTLEADIRRTSYMNLRWIIFTDDYRCLPVSVTEREDVSVLVFVRGYELLPGDCSQIIQNDSSYRGMIDLKGGGGRYDMCFDRVSLSEAVKYLRKTAGIRTRSRVIHSMIPLKVTIPQMYDIPFITQDMIRTNWLRNDTGNSLAAPIGKTSDNRNIYLDIHEKAYGPHGLIAGMTGSGKSEMLQTLILSMAIRYSPVELGFLLIDYKGGGMANVFKDLPHLMGSISNLSGNVIHRAMVSIRSENERRQRLFLKAGVNSIRDYSARYRAGHLSEPLPHIVIIIDEFAELKRSEPDFMKELISVAQVGRSLGVHLILATQKPAGTVDDNIFSNSRFHICLRVQDKQDSNDMLHRPDASFIQNPGRAFLQVGNDELFEEFQAGYTMERYEDKDRREGQMYILDASGHKQEVFRDEIKGDDEGEDAEKKTHCQVLLEMLKACNDEMSFPLIRSMWLEPLKSCIVYDYDSDASGDPFDIVLGKYDEPAFQCQDIYRLNLIEAGHIVICGSALTGKSTMLQTMLYSFASHCKADDLNVYVVDYSNGLLSGFRDSAIIGGYLAEEDAGKLGNLFCMLLDIMKERRLAFDGITFRERLANEKTREKAIVLMIDNYGRFREKTELSHDRDMLELIKFGESYGIYVILTGSCISSNDIPARLFENCRTGICLRLNDKYQYAECLREMRIPIMPAEGIRGRGLARIQGGILEFQAALCHEGTDLERIDWIRERILRINSRNGQGRAMPVPFIPAEPTVSDVDRVIPDNGYDGIILGYEAVSGRIFSLNEGDFSCVVFAGRKNSGKSNALRVYEYYAKKRGYKVVFAKSIQEIYALSKEENDRVIMVDGITGIIEEFYGRSYDRETESGLLEMMDRKDGFRFAFTMDPDDHLKAVGRKLYERVLRDCYCIYLGGGMDKQNMFDFSYLGFSVMCMTKPAGHGTVLKRNGVMGAGDLVIPMCA